MITLHKPFTIDSEKISPYNGNLLVEVTLDSTSYKTRSEVSARFKVSDKDGNPVKAKLALSIFDCLYRYKPSEICLSTRCYIDENFGLRKTVQPFLADGASSGVLKIGRKGKDPAEGQWINVFDVDAAPGTINLVETDKGGRFEIPYDFCQNLGRELVMKPYTSGKNPVLVFDQPFEELDLIRKMHLTFFFR